MRLLFDTKNLINEIILEWHVIHLEIKIFFVVGVIMCIWLGFREDK